MTNAVPKRKPPRPAQDSPPVALQKPRWLSFNTPAADGQDARAGAAAYNYAVFPPASDRNHFADFADHLKVGAEAPDGELVRLGPGDDTERVRLSDYWRDGNLVVEFGSVT
jgi:hypothetical protein